MQKGFHFGKDILDKNSHRNNHLLAIAINDYAHCPKLNNAVKDVQDFINVMLDKFEFEEENITFLKDKYATKNNIVKHFRQLIKSLSANDNLVIYFSGHGEFDDIEDEGYWLTQEVRQGNHANYLPNTRIKKLISKINAHHIFLISDSCFSGALFDKSTKSLHEVYERDASRWGLTSGRNEIVTDGKPGENSPFAISLLYALRNANEPLPILKLCQNVQDNTTINANQSPRFERIDGSGHRGGQFVFRLKNNIEKAWQQTLAINTIEAYIAFETQYPNSKYEQYIDTKIREVEDDEEWQEAKEANKVSKYRRYKKLFPKGKYKTEAQDAIKIILAKAKEAERKRQAKIEMDRIAKKQAAEAKRLADKKIKEEAERKAEEAERKHQAKIKADKIAKEQAAEAIRLADKKEKEETNRKAMIDKSPFTNQMIKVEGEIFIMNSIKAYLIYCIDNQNVARNISHDLGRVGIDFIHDTFDSSNHKYLRQQYTNSNAPVFLLVSDNFLKSEDCMRNILELVEDTRLKNRIKIVILEGRHKINGTNQYETVPTKFQRLSDVVNYINYWTMQYKSIRTEMRHASGERKSALASKLDLIRDISTKILIDFMRYLRGANYVVYNRLQDNNFGQMFEAFGEHSSVLMSRYRLLPAYTPEVGDL